MSPADLLKRAQAQGLLPAGAVWPTTEQRPWPVQLLTAVGAWFAAVPLLAFIGGLLGPLVRDGAGLWAVGAALIVAAVLLLRDRAVPLFVEQLAVPLLLVGLLCLGWRLHESLPDEAAWMALAALCLGLAWPLPRPWLRALLGASAAACLWVSTRPWTGAWHAPALPQWAAAAGLLAVWARLNRTPWPARAAQAWDAAGAGWLLTVLVALALHSGSPFLVAGLTGLHGGGPHSTHPGASVLALGSVATALLGAVLLTRAWPALRTLRWTLLAGLVALLAGVLPALGPIALAAALCARQQRWRLATAAGLAALWVLGAFYYQLAWPLAHKALGLVALGLTVGLLAAGPRPRAATGGDPVRRPWGAMLALALTLAVANGAILQKERLIAQGEPLFVPLAPADPRSLMQGDYMRLAFSVPTDAPPPRASWGTTWGAQRPQVVLRRDAQGIANFVRPDDGRPLAADERRVELSPKDGRWILVTDAWFFREGEAERWQRARFGEFRVTPDGRALLVGLRGEGLAPL